jgi:hypothetical protein
VFEKGVPAVKFFYFNLMYLVEKNLHLKREDAVFTTCFEDFIEHSCVSNKVMPDFKTWHGWKVNPVTTPKLLGIYLIAQRTRREVGVPDIPGAMAPTTAVQLPCALLASGACTLLVATHHIHPQTSGVRSYLSMRQ